MGASLWRLDPQKDFSISAAYTEIPILRSAGRGSLELSRPGASDGRYLYLIDQYEIVRLDTRGDPLDAASWHTEALDRLMTRGSVPSTP